MSLCTSDSLALYKGKNSNIKIMVALHKPYRVPADGVYYPVQVGAEGKESIGFLGDNTGDNISVKNPNYCELTGLYWMWKNIPSDYLGLVHYRRYFVSKKGSDKWECIADRKDIVSKLQEVPVILPKKREYFIETNYSQYAHAHHAVDLDTTRIILENDYPEYLNAFDENMKKTSGHKFNMFIMRRDLADAYCTWLFNILFKLESVLDISTYSVNDARVFGFVAERLLDTWIDTNKIKYVEMPVMFMEKQNWLIKGGNFLKRKFLK